MVNSQPLSLRRRSLTRGWLLSWKRNWSHLRRRWRYEVSIRNHFLSPVVINWSIIVWALLAKSPNWASHITNVLGSAWEYPYSKPSTPYSDKKLSIISKYPCCFLKCIVMNDKLYLLNTYLPFNFFEI